MWLFKAKRLDNNVVYNDFSFHQQFDTQLVDNYGLHCSSLGLQLWYLTQNNHCCYRIDCYG